MNKDKSLFIAVEALQKIAAQTYDAWTNGAEAKRIAQTALDKVKPCHAVQTSDQINCQCGNVWDVNDPCPPACLLKYDMNTGRMIEVTLEEL